MMTVAMNEKTNPSERRRFERKVVKIGANAILANSEDSFECTILDISKSGAKLELKGVDIIPARFKIFIPDADYIHECELIWRDGDHLGVHFVQLQK